MKNTMKKFFFSALLLATVVGASAQSRNGATDDILRGGSYPTVSNGYPGPDNRYDPNGRYNNDHRYDNDRRESDRRDWERNDRLRRDEAIRRINADYDYRINCVRQDRGLRNRDRKRQIESLERERQLRIRDVQTAPMARYDNRGRGY